MDGGQPCRPKILIVSLVPRASLRRSVQEGYFVSTANRPISSAWSLPAFENGALISQGAKLVGRHQPRDPSAQDHCLHSLARPWRSRLSSVGGPRHQSHALHHEEGGAVSACPPYAIQEFPPAHCHGIYFLSGKESGVPLHGPQRRSVRLRSRWTESDHAPRARSDQKYRTE